MSRIAIDMGGTNLRVALVNNGRFETQVEEPCRADGSEEEVMQQFFRLIEAVDDGHAERIGVAVPSVVDFARGIVYDVVNVPSWKEVHLKQRLEERFGVETRVDNDVNCFVNGEKHFGAGRDYSSLVGITLGTGVGAGIITNGSLYRGANTGAGEIGCLPYLDSNYEAYTSSQLFKQWHTTGKADSERAMHGDATALAHWTTLGRHLGKLLQAILYTYDPEAIIIGGGIARSRQFFADEMLASMHEGFQYPHEADRVKVLFSELKDCNLLGASQL